MTEVLVQKKAVNKSLKQWREKEKTALELLTIVGELRFDRAIELILFRQDIYDARPSELINAHHFAQLLWGTIPISVASTPKPDIRQKTWCKTFRIA